MSSVPPASVAVHDRYPSTVLLKRGDLILKTENSSKKLEKALSREFSQIQLQEKSEENPNKNKIEKSLSRGLSKINLYK